MNTRTGATSKRARRRSKHRAAVVALCLGTTVVGVGCGRGPDELLVAYSGNSLAYIEPCG